MCSIGEEEIEIRAWAAAEDIGTTHDGGSLIPYKAKNGAVFDQTLRYITFDNLIGGGAVSHTELGFAGSTAAKGTGKSDGNSDHDDSYPHFYADGGTGAQDVVNTKSIHTTGEIHADDFVVQDRVANKWNAEALTVDATGAANITAGAASIFDVTGKHTIGVAGNSTEVEINTALFDVNASDFDLELLGSLTINALTGVTGDGFTKGIKTDDTAMRAAIETQVQDILAGVGGLL